MNREKTNILWLVDHLGFNGVMHGASIYYLNTIPVFNKESFNVVLCVLRKEDHITEKFRKKGIDVRHLGRGKFDPRTFTDILELVKKENIQLIHAHGYGSANFGRMTKLGKRIPVVVHSHDNDRNYPFHQKAADLFLRDLTDRAIAVSESVKESGIRKRHFREDRIILLHNGIPLEDFVSPVESRVQEERERLGLKRESLVVGTVARLREEKGVEHLIRSVAKVIESVPNAVFLVAGDGPLRNDLEDLAKSLGVRDKVVFAGFCEDIPAVLSIMDIVAVPSLTEGLGIALLEAMAMGKPIVATNVGGMLELLKDGENGVFVHPNDPGMLSDRIIYLLNNKNVAMRLGANAKESSKSHDIKAHVRKLENIYIDLINAS